MSLNTSTDIWVAGAFAAITVDLLVYPLDTIKTRIQSHNYTSTYRPTGTLNTKLLLRGLYQGVGPVILATIPASGAFFTTYEAAKYFLGELSPPNSTLYLPTPAIHALASVSAELVSCAILTPAEVIKQNAQVVQHQKGAKKGPNPTMEVFRQLRRRPRSLWRGYGALAARNLPFTGLQFPLMEMFKAWELERRSRRKGAKVDGPLERALVTAESAAVAGSFSAWITTPIDVVKTRIMLAAGEEKEGDRKTRKTGWTVGKEVLRDEGMRGLFRGAALRSVWTAMGSGLYLGCYEGGRHYLEKRRNDSKLSEGDSVV